MKHLTRHEFLAAIAVIGASATVGCGSDSDEEGTGGSGGTGGGTGGSGGSGTGGTGGSGGSGTGGTGGSGTGGSGGSAGASGSAGTAGSAGSSSASCDMEIDAQITCRHGHDLLISVADIQAGQTKTYDIQGTASHSHMVEVTAAMFAQLLAGETVEIFVPSQFQPHRVVISCAGLPSHLLDDTECN